MSKNNQGPWGREAEASAELDREHSIRHLILDGIERMLCERSTAHFERPSGSYCAALGRRDGESVVMLLKRLAEQCAFSEVTAAARADGVAFGQCRYFRATLPGAFQGLEAAALASDLTPEQLASVRLVQGAHGLELVAPDIPMRSTDELHVIIGHLDDPELPPENNPAIYIWFPGRILPPFRDCAIKLG